MRQSWIILLAVGSLAIPGAVLRLTEPHWPVGLETALFGLAVLAVAFLLTWTAEAAETEISQGVAVGILALIAVLPEYAVDFVFTWSAPGNPENAAFATANMTGANRLLIGFGWALVIFLFWFRTKRARFRLSGHRFKDLAFLSVATAWSFTIPLRDELPTGLPEGLSLIDTAVLVSLFVAYLYSSRGSHGDVVELVEPAKTIAQQPKLRRRALLLGLFAYAAGMIVVVAEPFAEGLVESGKAAGIDEFLLVQWLAPLASEAPEIIIASLLVLRGRTAVAMAVLISSKVNQWTLLIGTLPAVYAVSGGFWDPLPLDSRQVEEIFLTSAQSLFAIVLLANLRFSLREGALLFGLFITQVFFTDPTIRYVYAFGYLALAVLFTILQRVEIGEVLRSRGKIEGAMEEQPG